MSSRVFNSITGGRNRGLGRAQRNNLARDVAARMTADARSEGLAVSYRFNSSSGTIYAYRTDGSGSPATA